MKILKITLLIVPLVLLTYSIFFEPFHLESTSHDITLGLSGKSLLVAHVTDLHTDGMGRLELKLIDDILSKKPDAILITGDIATPGGTIKGYEEVLSKFKAPMGVYFVQGNWEYWEPIKDLDKVLEKTNIVNLTNKHTLLKDNLWLVGLDDELAGSPDLRTFEKIPAGSKIISIFHSPNLFKSLNDQTDLAFAGHAHGGQIRIPFIGALWTPDGTGKYESGWFHEKRGKMYVSRGIGNSILPIRFNCRPEIAYIKITY